jgi:hypothetical protein
MAGGRKPVYSSTPIQGSSSTSSSPSSSVAAKKPAILPSTSMLASTLSSSSSSSSSTEDKDLKPARDAFAQGQYDKALSLLSSQPISLKLLFLRIDICLKRRHFPDAKPMYSDLSNAITFLKETSETFEKDLNKLMQLEQAVIFRSYLRYVGPPLILEKAITIGQLKAYEEFIKVVNAYNPADINTIKALETRFPRKDTWVCAIDVARRVGEKARHISFFYDAIYMMKIVAKMFPSSKNDMILTAKFRDTLRSLAEAHDSQEHPKKAQEYRVLASDYSKRVLTMALSLEKEKGIYLKRVTPFDCYTVAIKVHCEANQISEAEQLLNDAAKRYSISPIQEGDQPNGFRNANPFIKSERGLAGFAYREVEEARARTRNEIPSTSPLSTETKAPVSLSAGTTAAVASTSVSSMTAIASTPPPAKAILKEAVSTSVSTIPISSSSTTGNLTSAPATATAVASASTLAKATAKTATSTSMTTSTISTSSISSTITASTVQALTPSIARASSSTAAIISSSATGTLTPTLATTITAPASTSTSAKATMSVTASTILPSSSLTTAAPSITQALTLSPAKTPSSMAATILSSTTGISAPTTTTAPASTSTPAKTTAVISPLINNNSREIKRIGEVGIQDEEERKGESKEPIFNPSVQEDEGYQEYNNDENDEYEHNEYNEYGEYEEEQEEIIPPLQTISSSLPATYFFEPPYPATSYAPTGGSVYYSSAPSYATPTMPLGGPTMDPNRMFVPVPQDYYPPTPSYATPAVPYPTYYPAASYPFSAYSSWNSNMALVPVPQGHHQFPAPLPTSSYPSSSAAVIPHGYEYGHEYGYPLSQVGLPASMPSLVSPPTTLSPMSLTVNVTGGNVNIFTALPSASAPLTSGTSSVGIFSSSSSSRSSQNHSSNARLTRQQHSHNRGEY